MCDSQEWTSSGLCSTCHEISKIIACYDSKDVLESLTTIYLREKQKCDNKTEVVKKEYNTRSKEKDVKSDFSGRHIPVVNFQHKYGHSGAIYI